MVAVVAVGIGSDCWYVNICRRSVRRSVGRSVGRSVLEGAAIKLLVSGEMLSVGGRCAVVGRLHQAVDLSLWWLLAWLGGERWRGVVGVWLAMGTDHVCLWRRAVPIYRRHLVAIVGCLWWSSVCWCCVRCRLRGGWLYDVTAAGVLPGA